MLAKMTPKEKKKYLRKKRREERKKRQFYQLVADFTFGWEIWLEPGGKIKYCSPSCYDLTGFTSNQIFKFNRKCWIFLVVH